MNTCFLPKHFFPNGFLASHFLSGKTMCFFPDQEDRKDLKETWISLGRLPFGFFFDCFAVLLGSTIGNYLSSKGHRYLCDQWFSRLVALPYHVGKPQNSTTQGSKEYLVRHTKGILGVLDWCIAEPIPPKNYTLDFVCFCWNVRALFGSDDLRTILSNTCPCLDPCAQRLSKIQCHKMGTHGLFGGVL